MIRPVEHHSGSDSGGTDPDPPGVVSVGLRPGDRGRTAYPLNVQTGCDERCAYCIVPSTRGPGRSRGVAQVVDEVRGLADAGFREVWLTGVHLGSYGRDLAPPCRLIDLLRALDREAAALDVCVSPQFARADGLQRRDRRPRGGVAPLCPAPAPAAAARERQDAGGHEAAVHRLPVPRASSSGLRAQMPDAAIGTDVIAGFPGETERDFRELEGFLREMSPSYLHVFPYSDRPGTAASAMPSKVPEPVVRQRAERLRDIARELSARFADGQVGRERAALTLDDGAVALTDNYLKLRIARGRARNERVRVRIVPGRPLRGEVVA